jgi:hypothetical protein
MRKYSKATEIKNQRGKQEIAQRKLARRRDPILRTKSDVRHMCAQEVHTYNNNIIEDIKNNVI